MNEKTQIKLSPIERATRNVIVRNLSKAGFSVSSIAAIMSMHQSTVSRIIDNTDNEVSIADIILSGN